MRAFRFFFFCRFEEQAFHLAVDHHLVHHTGDSSVFVICSGGQYSSDTEEARSTETEETTHRLRRRHSNSFGR